MRPVFLIELLNRTPAWKSNVGPILSCKSGFLWLPLGFHSHIAPNLVQSSCRIDEECAMATTLQHGFWCFVSLCAPVVVQCTAFTGLCHQTVGQETGLMVLDDVCDPIFLVCGPHCP